MYFCGFRFAFSAMVTEAVKITMIQLKKPAMKNRKSFATYRSHRSTFRRCHFRYFDCTFPDEHGYPYDYQNGTHEDKP
jgi:hypothetical protein